MPKRKKRAKKAQSSLEKQIEKHEKKLKDERWEPRRGYYQKEIARLRGQREEKKKLAE